MPFRFVHAADIHLDSPLRSLALRDPDLAELIGNATRRAFTAIVDLCLNEQVDALLLSGDLYDNKQTSMKTARFLAAEIGRLHQAGIRVCIIRGNHDAISVITRELTFPAETVTLFGGRLRSIPLARAAHLQPVVIHGISFDKEHAPESLLPRFAPPVEAAVNIGLLHTSLGGAPGHDRYAPCSVAELRQAGFRYWALGHVHKRDVTADEMTTVVMPGMPQGRDIGEDGEKSVTLVTVTDAGAIIVEERHTGVAQFERVTVALDGLTEWREMVAAVAVALGAARDRVAAEHLVARLRFTGATPLAWRLRRDPDLLRAEVENQAAGLGRTAIDKVELLCRAPDAALPGDGAEADPLDELRRLMAAVTDDDAYRAELGEIAVELLQLLPPECRALLGEDAGAVDAALAAIARDGVDDVLARLRPGEPAEAG